MPATLDSSPDTPDFSMELTDSLALCDGVVEVAVLIGRLTLVAAVTGRAAGLFRVLPVDRAVVDAVGFVAVDVVFAGVGFVLMPGTLFGGTLVFEAGFAGDFFSDGLDMLGKRSSNGGVCFRGDPGCSFSLAVDMVCSALKRGHEQRNDRIKGHNVYGKGGCQGTQ